MFTTGYWRQLYGIRRVLDGLVVQDVGTRLNGRAPGPRGEAADNSIFASLADATAVAIAQRDYQFAIELFGECFELARQYEAAAQCEVHKGAMTFNVAVAYLRANDFPAAMHYFEVAQRETRLTTGDSGWGVYQSGLFQQNYWDVLDLYEQQSPTSLYPTFWGAPYTSAAAKQDWGALSDHSKLLFLMVNAERISYRRLAPLPNWPGGESVGLAYWNLIADLSRLLETELGERGITGGGLRAKVLYGINNSPIAGFKAEVTGLHQAKPVNSPADFNTHYPALQAVISDPAETREKRIATAAYLAAVTRNQVQHQVDTGMIIFTDRMAAAFTSEVLLSLCRLGPWVL